jgi:hypothetical protein
MRPYNLNTFADGVHVGAMLNMPTGIASSSIFFVPATSAPTSEVE